MVVKQIATLMNTVTGEILGKSDIVAEDLSNVVDVGTEIFNASSVDNYVKTLVNHIGKVIFVNRPYSGGAPSVLMDGWEYGSVLEKIQADIPEAEENPSWALEDGTTYNQDIFKKPSVSVKFFNSKTTFEIPYSFTERQVKESFSNAEQLNAFLSMLYAAVDKSLTVKMDALIMRTINNATATTLHDAFPAGTYSENSTVRAVNLLHLYKAVHPNATTTAGNFLYDLDFLKFASRQISLVKSRMTKISSLYNIGKKERFTPDDMAHLILLSDFAKSTETYLQSSTFHDELVKLPSYEEVPYWQASGDDYDFGVVSKVNVTTAAGDQVEASGIIGVLFDRDALGVTNMDRRVTTHYNAKGEFFNNWYKFDAGYFNDFNENFVVFFVA